MLAGAAVTGDDPAAADADWSRVNRRPLAGADAEGAAGPDGDGVDPGRGPEGARCGPTRGWHALAALLSGLGLGACLADDMGLGKTIQVLSLLLMRKAERAAQPLVAPASLLGNWAAEIERFAPGLRAVIVHPSAMAADQIRPFSAERAAEFDLCITSYGSLLRMPALAETAWRFVDPG